MRRELTGEGEYFHIYSRGVDKRRIYENIGDYERFLLSMFACRGAGTYSHISRLHAGQHLMLTAKVAEINDEIRDDPKIVEIISFCLMPNHFHLLLKEVTASGISKFMQRLDNSYTKYFNIKYVRTGHLFGSSFKSIRIDSNEYLLYLSRYIHQNPREILRDFPKLRQFAWSSYKDFIEENRWGEGLSPTVILDQFGTLREYREYVEEDLEINIDPTYLLEVTE